MADKRLLAIVPARGGSKRLPRKNVLSLGGKPLIGWTIDAALDSHCFVDVLVSTDDEEIAAVAGNHGALVPWLRPVELATDTARSIDVVLHALDWYEHERGTVNGMMLLQPTSPLRSATTIRAAANHFFELGADAPVVSVSPAEKHPAWTFSLEGARMQPFCGWESLKLRSQELPPAYTLNGAIYVCSPKRLRIDQSFFAKDMQALVMTNYEENLDIDTDEDWALAEWQVTRMTGK
ncbi:MAG: cytidylyltransferase domain-containing protein [Steroidobacteraceae bacterium]